MTRYCGYFSGDCNKATTININNISSIIGDNSRYIEAKIMFKNNDIGGTLFSYGTAARGRPIFFMYFRRNSIETEFGSKYKKTIYTFTEPLINDKWYRVGMSYENGICRIFLDDEEVMSITDIGYISSAQSGLGIGYMIWDTSVEKFTG